MSALTRTGRTLRITGSVLLGFLMSVVLLGVVALAILPPVMHYQTYVVMSGSMEPAIHTGSVVVAVAVPPDSLQVGDIITFSRAGDQESITHRIVTIKGTASEWAFVTKGDANGAEDPGETRFDRLAGKVVYVVPFLGYIFKFFGSSDMRWVMIVIPGLVLLGTWVVEIWRPKSNSRTPDAAIVHLRR